MQTYAHSFFDNFISNLFLCRDFPKFSQKIKSDKLKLYFVIYSKLVFLDRRPINLLILFVSRDSSVSQIPFLQNSYPNLAALPPAPANFLYSMSFNFAVIHLISFSFQT